MIKPRELESDKGRGIWVTITAAAAGESRLCGRPPKDRETGTFPVTRKGNQWLRTTLVQVAWAASRTKHTYLSSQYRRLASRRGKKRALMAVGHTILVMIYDLLREGTTYAELGANYFDRLDTERLTRTLVRRLERLGHEVVLKPKEPAA
jgi:hypothetical protein